MKRFEIGTAKTVYRAPDGWQGYYPRLACLDERDWLVSYVASSDIEAPDSHPRLARSLDGGDTWQIEGPVEKDQQIRAGLAETGFIQRTKDGTLFCVGPQWRRQQGVDHLVDPKTLGMLDNRVVLRRSVDRGHTWSEPVEIPKPYDVPLEVPTAPIELGDGTLVLSCSTWRKPDGACPFGHRVTSMRLPANGSQWQGPVDIFYDPEGRIGFWEGRIACFANGRLLATCWAHNWEAGRDEPNHFGFSEDGGRSWSMAGPTSVMGQTAWPLVLDDDTLLLVYNHRQAPVGVRAQVVDISRGRWETLFDAEVWSPENRKEATISSGNYAVPGFQFGAPSAVRLNANRVAVIFWSVQGGRAGIDWCELALCNE